MLENEEWVLGLVLEGHQILKYDVMFMKNEAGYLRNITSWSMVLGLVLEEHHILKYDVIFIM